MGRYSAFGTLICEQWKPVRWLAVRIDSDKSTVIFVTLLHGVGVREATDATLMKQIQAPGEGYQQSELAWELVHFHAKSNT